MKDVLQIYLKGMLMGIADLVPGISGGTIAFITGIYSRFITALSSLGPLVFWELIMLLFKGQLKDFFVQIRKYEFDFLFILVLGIATSLFGGALGISWLFDNFEPFVLAFFIGLILSSSLFLFEEISHKGFNFWILTGIGFSLGVLLFFLPVVGLGNSLLILFFGGMIASSAMIIPGISGSFLLLILGIYTLLLQYLSSPFTYFFELGVFFMGIVTSILIFSKMLKILLETRKNSLFSFLLGLVIGALLIPIGSLDVFSLFSVLFTSFLFLFGFFLGFILKNYR